MDLNPSRGYEHSVKQDLLGGSGEGGWQGVRGGHASAGGGGGMGGLPSSPNASVVQSAQLLQGHGKSVLVTQEGL